VATTNGMHNQNYEDLPYYAHSGINHAGERELLDVFAGFQASG